MSPPDGPALPGRGCTADAARFDDFNFLVEAALLQLGSQNVPQRIAAGTDAAGAGANQYVSANHCLSLRFLFLADGEVVHLFALFEVFGDNLFCLLGVEPRVGGLLPARLLDANDRLDVLRPTSPVTRTSTSSSPRFSISSSMVFITSRAPAAMPLVPMLTTTRYFLLPSRKATCRCAFSFNFLSSSRFICFLLAAPDSFGAACDFFFCRFFGAEMELFLVTRIVELHVHRRVGSAQGQDRRIQVAQRRPVHVRQLHRSRDGRAGARFGTNVEFPIAHLRRLAQQGQAQADVLFAALLWWSGPPAHA